MFFLFPVAVDYDARRYPVVTLTLLGINAAFYLLGFLLGIANEGQVDPLVSALGLIPQERQVWTWFTYAFVHAGFFHFAGNMVYLYLFGACIEDLLGRPLFSAFYLGGSLFAGLTQVVFSNDFSASIPIVGASGAITTCLGAFAVALPRTRINFRYYGWLLRFFAGEFWLSSWILVSLWFALDLLRLFLQLSGPRVGGGVAFAAHVGGMVIGAVFMRLYKFRIAADLPSAGDQPIEPLQLQVRRASPPVSLEKADIYLNLQDPPAGPFTLSNVREMLLLGGLSPDTCYWREGMTEWRPVAELRTAEL